MRRAGERLRITLQLIDAISDEHRWAETFDRTLSDVFEIQAEVANRTAAALKVELLDTDRDASSRPPVRGLDAYELYLRGIVGFQRAADEGWPRYAIEDPIRCFEGAIAKDPSSAAARAWLANLYIAAMGETISKGEVATKVRELVTAAYRLDADEAEVRTARGNYALQFERDWVRAEQEFLAAIEISPSAMSAHAWLGILQITLGRPVEAARELEIAIDLDPMFLNLTTWRIRALDLGGDLSAAILLAERTLERFPSNRTLHVLTGALYLRAGTKGGRGTGGAARGGPTGGGVPRYRTRGTSGRPRRHGGGVGDSSELGDENGGVVHPPELRRGHVRCTRGEGEGSPTAGVGLPPGRAEPLDRLSAALVRFDPRRPPVRCPAQGDEPLAVMPRVSMAI